MKSRYPVLTAILLVASGSGPREFELRAEAAPARPLDIHYVATPQALVETMLKMVNVGKSDIVYDLGSGDGRMVITAARRYGATGVGIDMDPRRIREATENAKAAGVDNQVRFIEQDIFQADFSDATVIALYLLESLNLRLRPQIFVQVKPGTRVVSHAFAMGDWQPDERTTVHVGGQTYDAYRWVVPANINGRWKISGGESAGLPQSVIVQQNFQNITVRSATGGRVLGRGKINGTALELRMSARAVGRSNLFRGTINGEAIAASGEQNERWSGTREIGTEKPLDSNR